MKVIDARSGQHMNPGDIVTYPGGEWLYLERVDAGLFKAQAVIHTGENNPAGTRVNGKRQKVPLVVRWTHPGFLFQHVAFLPS